MSYGNVSIIAAIDIAAGFGLDGKIPWNIPEDMKRFRTLTQNSHCIMGRKTYVDMLQMARERRGEMIYNPKVLLPNRKSYVLSSFLDYAPGAHVVDDLKRTITDIRKNSDQPIFILGGAGVFKEALPFVDKVFLTVVKVDYKCDVFFPIVDMAMQGFAITKQEHTMDCKFIDYERK